MYIQSIFIFFCIQYSSKLPISLFYKENQDRYLHKYAGPSLEFWKYLERKKNFFKEIQSKYIFFSFY